MTRTELFSRIDFIPDDTTHVDLHQPEYLKLDDGQWYYWKVTGGYKGSWHVEAEANTSDWATQDYIKLGRKK